MVNMGEMFAYRRIGNISMDRVPVGPKEIEYLLETGDLLFARQSLVRSGAGKCVLFQGCDESVTFESHVIRARLNQAVADPRFYFYFFESSFGRHAIESIVEQVAAAGIRGSDLKMLKVPVPPLSEQRAIAHILGTLDDKIELNRRMNETLEGIARALFQSWFVDFDPVRAKAEGRRPASMDAETAALFPDSFQESALGPIPAGWKVTTLGAVSEKPQYGYTASAQPEPVGPHFLRITDINKLNWIQWEDVPYCDASVQDLEKFKLHVGDIVIARIADPGHGAMIESEVGAIFASYLIRFRPHDERYSHYLQYWLRSDRYWATVRGYQSGSTRGNLNAQVLSRFPLLAPPAELLGRFSTTINALRSKIVASVDENGTLATIRDTLLPKLISGELRVPDAEKLLAESPV
jgi:type I restriction enzyme S subunit